MTPVVHAPVESAGLMIMHERISRWARGSRLALHHQRRDADRHPLDLQRTTPPWTPSDSDGDARPRLGDAPSSRRVSPRRSLFSRVPARWLWNTCDYRSRSGRLPVRVVNLAYAGVHDVSTRARKPGFGPSTAQGPSGIRGFRGVRGSRHPVAGLHRRSRRLGATWAAALPRRP